MARTNKTDLKALFNNVLVITEESMVNLIDSFDPATLDLDTNDPIGDSVVADINTEGVALDGSRWKKVGAGNNEWEQIIMAGSGTAADVNPAGTAIVEALDTKLNSNYANPTYFGDDLGVVTIKNIIGELASGDVTAGSELVQIGNSVTSIGSYAFAYWTGNNQPLVIPDSVTEIGWSAFQFWTANNQPLVIPDSVTTIGDYAFYFWESNNHPLVIPDSVETIGSFAFYYWYDNNQPLVIPDTVTSIEIEIGAFSRWTSNNQPVVIPDSVTSIGNYAFDFWTANNQPLVIGAVTSIGTYAFAGWTSMTEPIYCGFNFSAFTGSGAFYYNGVTQIYVKPGATGWDFDNNPQEIQGASGVTVSNWVNYPNPIPN